MCTRFFYPVACFIFLWTVHILYPFSKLGSWSELKSWLKTQHSKNKCHGIWSHHFMANRWGNNGNSDRLYFGGSKITADWDRSHEIKRCLPLGRKAMTNLDSILKSRDITLPTKVHLVKAMVFPVVTYECDIWNIEKAEHQRIDAFELRCWRRLLRVPWSARRSHQSILKKSTLNICWKDWNWSSNNLATWYEEQTHWKRPWCWERLRAGGEGGVRGWDDWIALLTQWIWIWANSGS